MVDIKWAKEEVKEQEEIVVASTEQLEDAENWLAQCKSDQVTARAELRRKKAFLRSKEQELSSLREKEKNNDIVSSQNISYK